MLFNSLVFVAFLAIVYPLYLVLPHRLQNRMLLIASYVFYGWWDWRFMGLLALSTTFDFFVTHALTRQTDPARRKRLVMMSITMNMGLLGFFKYFNFFVGSLIDGLRAVGVNVDWTALHILLPVGISFYTFQAVAFAVDVYREEVKPPDNFLDFALFIAFFPQLVAGPIERASNMLRQVLAPRRVELPGVLRGCFLILFGLFKKVVLADGIAPAVNSVFDETWNVSGTEVLAASYLFALQIYCDFSGYTDVARGVSKLMGFNLMKNFRTPFFSASPSEYWTRWHISLSSWVKDYVYFPMALAFMRKGDTRANELKPHLYSMIIMGLWHGAAWTYVIWGVFHGSMLVLWNLKYPKPLKRFAKKVPRPAWIVFYLQITVFSMMLFRAESLDQIGRFTWALLTNLTGGIVAMERPMGVAMMAVPLLLLFDFYGFRRSSELFYQRWPRPIRAAVYTAMAILLTMGASNAPAEFIYFQF